MSININIKRLRLLVTVIFVSLFSSAANAQCADGEWTTAIQPSGVGLLPNGEEWCMVGPGAIISGSAQVRDNGVLTICDTVRLNGSLTMDAGSKLVMNEGAVLVITGSFTADFGQTDAWDTDGDGGIYYGGAAGTGCGAQIIMNSTAPSVSIQKQGMIRSGDVYIGTSGGAGIGGGVCGVAGCISYTDASGVANSQNGINPNFDYTTGYWKPASSCSLNNCGTCAAVVAGTIGGGTTICEGATTGLTSTVAASGGDGASYTYQWETSFNGGAWGNASGTSTNATYTTAALAAGTHDFRRKVTSGACGDATTATVTVTATANNTAGVASSTPTLCVNTALTNITHATTGATGIGAAVDLPAGVTAAWAGNVITISGTPTTAIGSPFSYSIPLTGGCGTVNATGTITVQENTAGAASSTPTLCVNTALTNITHTTTGATGIGAAVDLPAGVSAAWAGNVITISGTPTASGTFNYSIPLTGGCGSINATGTITVTANNTAGVASSTPTLCINTALTNITHATTGATGIGAAVDLPAGVSAAWAGDVITISGTPTASGTFNYSIPLTGGCGTVNATGTITVEENTAGAGSSSPTLCVNTALTNITHATTGATGIGAAVDLPAGVSAAWAGNVITISGTPSASGTFNYSIPLTGGCGTVNATGTITVTADNTAGAASSTPTLCINTALTNITHATTGATGIGAAVDLPAGVSAAWAGDVITVSGTPTASGTFNYSIPLSGGCGTVNATGTITVTADNTAGVASSTPTLCLNAALTDITHATTGATGISNDGVDAAGGLPAGVSATWAADVITISGTPTADGTFNYSIPLTGGCGTVNATGTITVYASVASGTVAADQSISVGGTPSTLTETVAAAGGDATYTYQWESSTNDGASWANAGGTDNQATYSPGALTVTTWYRRTATSGSSCGSAISNTVVITVNMYVCSGSTPSAISSGTAATVGATYQWEVSTTGGAPWSNAGGTDNLATYSPGSVAQDTWYRRAATFNGCTVYSNVLKATLSAGSPGGIATGLLVWLKADAGTGSIASQWDDQSGNNYHYSTSGSGVTVSAGDSTSNYNAFIELSNTQGFDAHASATLGSDHTIFVVAHKTSADNSGRILDGQISSNYAWGHNAAYGMALINNSNPSAGTASPATTNSAEVKMLQTFKRESSGAYTHRVDGASTASYGSSDDPTGELIDINQGAGGDPSSCRVFEVVIYNSALTTAEIEIVESYLMTKYGLGTNNNPYETSTGASTYDVSSYNTDIIGIGKECYFHQKQSGSGDDSTRIWVSSGAWAATNSAHSGSVTNDISYVMIGHNTGRLRATAAANAEKPATINNRLEREWKVTNTNFDDDFTLELEWDSAGAFDLADVRLLVDDDGDFSSGASIYASGDQGMTFALGSIIIKDIPVAVIPKGAVKFLAIGAVGATTLPVELLDFKALQRGDVVELEWTTAVEINNDYFVVEKSEDGTSWIELGIVQGAGNSATETFYSFTDYEMCKSVCYYRLRQVDFDGTEKETNPVLVAHQNEEFTKLRIYPNPVINDLQVSFVAESSAAYNLEILSVDGQSVYNAKVICAVGTNQFGVNLSEIAKGTYSLLIRNQQGVVLGEELLIK